MKKIKFAGPSKKMAEALEDEGLFIEWPKTVKDDEDLAIEATYTTGANDYEKIVLIDLRSYGNLASKRGVDTAIAAELEQAWQDYDVGEEMEIYLGTRGAPEPALLLADLQEAESRLERFSNVARAVALGNPIPVEDSKKEHTFKGEDLERLLDLLKKVAATEGNSIRLSNDEKAFAKMLADEIDAQ